MTFTIFGTKHLGEARCVCATSPKGRDGCPLHQTPEVVQQTTQAPDKHVG